GVTMFASQLSGGNIPGQSCTDAGDFVSCHLFAIARTTQHNAQGILTGSPLSGHGHGSINAKARIVVLGIIFLWTVINHLVAGRRKLFNKILGQFQTSMIGSDVNAHVSSSSSKLLAPA